MKIPLSQASRLALQIVSEIVESEFAIRSIRDIGSICVSP